MNMNNSSKKKKKKGFLREEVKFFLNFITPIAQLRFSIFVFPAIH